jgi:alkanesulfonate monooxygenase SsuD/methylene tetrahydromethanopterin reductase-like flavin-dependent oxidoreductase (luciferase family)
VKVHVFDLMPWPYLREPAVFPMPNADYKPELGNLLYKEHFDFLELAEALGFDGISFNEHHFSAYGGIPAPNIIVGALTQRTKKITLGIIGNCLPLRGHPIRIAEEVALLDVISGGRVISGFVRGVPQEFLAYNVDPKESRGRFNEAFDLIIKAWTAEEPFDWDGEFFRYKHVSLWPKPLQKPHPPIVFAGTTAESVEWAAEHNVSLASSFAPTDGLRDTFDYYRTQSQQHGWTPGPENISLQRHIYVAETNAKAREEAEAHLLYFFQTLMAPLGSDTVRNLAAQGLGSARSMEYRKVKERPKLWEMTFDRAQGDGYSIIGDADFVIRELKAQQRALGFGTIMGFFHFGSMPHSLAVKNITLFAKDVLPHVRD